MADHASIIVLFALATLLSISHSEYIPPGPAYPCPKETKSLLLYPCVCEKGTDAGLYVRCENAGLAVLSVGIGNIAGLGLPIERLLLKECKFLRANLHLTSNDKRFIFDYAGGQPTLPCAGLKGLCSKEITGLYRKQFHYYLRANLFGPLLHRSTIRVIEIEDTPIHTIDAYAFAGVNKTLQELYLRNTRIEEFPKEAFKILSNLTVLSIDGHRMARLSKDVFAGSEAAGRLERLRLTNGLIADIPIEAFQNLKKLKTLDLHGNKLTTLKRNQFRGLRDAEVLDISHNSIAKLDGSMIGDLTKLGWCNASHNQISDIPRGMFARNAVLKVLHLDNNKLKKLDTNSLKGMRFLRRLYLQDNQIADVGRGTFSSVTRIGTVDLARNKIAKVDYQMFQAVKYAEIINLAENQIKSIESQAFTDLYQANVNISYNELTTIEAGAFQNCNNMTLLDLSHNNLTDIDKKAFDENTYAYEFNVAYNGFTDFSQIPIQNMTGIAVLNVSYNSISVIPKQSFPKLYELHTVDVSHNALSEIFNAVFQNLFSLRYLNLSHNALEVIKPSTFGTIPTLLSLDLSHNALTSVSRGSMAKLSSARSIDLSHNQLETVFQIPASLGELNLAHNNLKELKSNTWPQMNALLRLDLSSNMLADNLQSDAFANLLTLQRLGLAGNGISRPPWEPLNGLSSLQYLYLQDNQISALGRSAFGNLPTLFEMDLSRNNLTTIAQQSFNGLQQLLNLTLRENLLEKIPNEAFKSLVALRRLDLSHNQLEKLDNKTNGLLDDCLSLEMVNLSYNNIGFLSKKMFPQSPWIPYRLQEVDLAHNSIPVLTFDITFGTKTVKKMNLSENVINDIRNNVIGNLTSLQILDLSNNQLKDLISRTSEVKFQLPENISELHLQNNELQNLPTDNIAKAKRLTYLDVRNNDLVSFEPAIVRKVLHEGLQVYFEGNKLKCDCRARPLKHYLNRLTPATLENDNKFKNITCSEPLSLINENIRTLDEDRLLCNGNTDSESGENSGENAGEMGRVGSREVGGGEFDFTAEPDVAFRDIQYSQTSLYAHWYVLTPEDVADFVIYIRDDKNAIHYSNEVSYNLRSMTIVIEKNLETSIKNGEKFDICVTAKTSNGPPRKWHASQCQKMAGDFESWPKKLSIDKRRLTKKKVRYSWFSNSVLGLVSDSILITMCIFLGVCLKLTDWE